ncbi:hypothetical protein KKE26_05775, partial [bacterium]|nr:hypothetical protein [bacterium]
PCRVFYAEGDYRQRATTDSQRATTDSQRATTGGLPLREHRRGFVHSLVSGVGAVPPCLP